MNPRTKSKVSKAVLAAHFASDMEDFDAEIFSILLNQETLMGSNVIHYNRKTYYPQMYTNPGKEFEYVHKATKVHFSLEEQLTNHIEDTKFISTRRSQFAAFLRKILNHSYTSGDLLALMPRNYIPVAEEAILEDNEVIENSSYTPDQITKFKENSKAGYNLVKEKKLYDFFVGS